MKAITAESLRIEREHLEQSQSKLLKSIKNTLDEYIQKRMEEKQSGEFHVPKEQMDAYLETINTSQLVSMSIALEQIAKEQPDTLSEDFQLASDLYAAFEKRAWMHAQKELQLPKCDYCGLTKCYCCPECGMDIAEGEHTDACIHNGPLSVEE